MYIVITWSACLAVSVTVFADIFDRRTYRTVIMIDIDDNTNDDEEDDTGFNITPSQNISCLIVGLML